MQFSILAVVSTLSAIVAAQTSSVNLSDLPRCAQTCIGNGLASTGCNGVNIECICKSSKWISDLSCCISKGCSAADQATTVKFAQQLCQTVGVTLPSEAGCGTTTSSTSSNSTSSNSTASTSRTSSSATTSATRNAAAAVGQTAGFGLAVAGLLAAAL